MNRFGHISDIDPNDSSTWETKYFITFDIDWAADEVLSDSIDLIEKYDVPVTWFVTHNTSLIQRLRNNPKFKLGIHPNFNFLLEGDDRNGSNAEEVVDNLLNIIPDANALRSHSLAQSEMLFDIFHKKEISFICNTFIPGNPRLNIFPWKIWDGMVVIPHCWQDNVSLRIPTENFLEFPENSLNVFDFHPIHVFLNTDKLERYEKTRSLHHNSKELLVHRYAGEGTRTKLLKLLNKKL